MSNLNGYLAAEPRIFRTRAVEAPAFSRRVLMLELLTREAGEEKPEDANRIRVVASTDVEYDWGYAKEKLVHEDGCVDRSGAFSALFNHDVDQVIGKIVKTEIAGGRMVAELEIDPEVRGTNGLPILKAIKAGYVKGVSIGYDYQRSDVVITEDESGKRTLTVNRWTLREISITPTPADLEAQVGRSVRSWFQEAATAEQKELDMNFEAWLKARGLDSATLSKDALAALRRDYEAEVARTASAKDDELKRERDRADKAERDAARVKFERSVELLARSFGLEVTEEEMKALKEIDDATKFLMGKKAAQEKPGNPQGSAAGGNVTVTRDAADKADEAAADGLLNLVPNLKRAADEKDLGMRSGSVMDIGRRWLAAQGFREVLELGRRELGEMLLGSGAQRLTRFERLRGKRDAANVTSGMFTSYVMANVMDKAVYNGFMAPAGGLTADAWVGKRQVSDFRQFTGAALDAGNLVETTENTAFPELAKEEGGYNGTLGMWGATISLTLQALINDDLGQFMKWLGMAGFIAKRTVDVKVYTELEGATWTNRTTSGNLSDANLAAARASLAGIAGPAGQTLGLNAVWLIVPSGLRKEALEITQVSSYIAPTAVKVNADIQPIITPFLTTKGTPANSEWYIAVDSMFDPLLVATLAGINAPIVEEYDAGAVAARKWKIMYPFVVVIPTVSSNVQGMWNYSGT